MRSTRLVSLIFLSLATSVASSVWLLACAPSPPTPPSNLLLISIDTLVPDRMSTYGNPRITTPAISELADGGLVFTRAYSPSPWTLPAHAAMLTGRYPMSLSPKPYDLGLYRAAPLLSQLFRAQGYQTGAVTGGGYVSAEFGMNRGFDSFEEGVADRAVDWLEGHTAEPFFFFFHSYLPHTGYNDRRFALELPQGRLSGAFLFGVEPVGQALCCELGMETSAAEREFLLALYDSDIAAADEEVALLFAALERLGLSDHTTVIVTSDHGEEFWQHTGLASRHGHTLYDELLSIPLIWSEPGLATAGTRCDARVNLVDLVPTLVARFGLTPPARSDGLDLSPLLDGCARVDEVHSFKEFNDRPLLAEGVRDGAARYSLRTSKGKLIETPDPELQRGGGEEFPIPVRARRELYLPGDLGEHHNAIDEHPELAAELTALLDTHRPRRPATSSQLETPPLSKKARDELKALGYIQ